MSDTATDDVDFEAAPEGFDNCVDCQPARPSDEFYTCDACGNAVCDKCVDEDDFGTSRCTLCSGGGP